MYLGSLAVGSSSAGLKMGLRFLIVLVVGLAGLYTIHLLSQDFFKFTNKIGSASSAITGASGKRDAESANRWMNITQQQIEFESKIDWNKILSRDPFSCALSIICQLSAGAEKNNEEANKIYEFITHAIEHSKVPKKLRKSYELGLNFNKNQKEDFTKCYENYPLCPYSAKTMIKFITFNKFLFGR